MTPMIPWHDVEELQQAWSLSGSGIEEHLISSICYTSLDCTYLQDLSTSTTEDNQWWLRSVTLRPVLLPRLWAEITGANAGRKSCPAKDLPTWSQFLSIHTGQEADGHLRDRSCTWTYDREWTKINGEEHAQRGVVSEARFYFNDDPHILMNKAW